jgi:glycogen(starch) synthase
VVDSLGPTGVDVLVVGWFPSAIDPGAGRFVADQAAALRATGRVRPWVVSFEAIPLFGDRRLRSAAEEVTERQLVTAIENGPSPFVRRGAAGPDGVPLARLGFAAGETTRTGAEHGWLHRAAVLGALSRRADRPPWRLVHGHVGYPEGAAASYVARRLGIPFVLTEHATYLRRIFANPAQRARYIETVRTATRVVTVSQMLSAELADELGRDVPDLPERLIVIPNAIAIDDFPVVGPDRRAEAEILWVGYRKPVKGIDILLRAFARVRSARPDARLRLIGASVAPTDDTYWQQLAASLGVADAVSIEGPVGRTGVAQAMARASVFAHPSNRETFGVVAAEALATGLPVVATDSGGVTEVLGPEPERFGALVPRQDPVALADAIVAVLERREAFDPWQLRRWVEERYAAPVVAARLAELYAEVLDETTRGSPTLSGMRSAPPAGTVSPNRTRVVVVGFHRSVLERAATAHPDVLAPTIVVSTGAEAVLPGRWILAPPEVGRRLATVLARGWHAKPPDTLRAAIRQTVRAGWRWARSFGRRIRTLLGGSDDLDVTLSALRAILGAALADPASDGTPPGGHVEPSPLLVCVTGFDHLTAEPFVRAGARVAPGGLGWLADELAAAGHPAPASRAADTDLERASPQLPPSS